MLKAACLLLFVALASACSSVSIPQYSQDQALLVVPKQNQNTSSEQWSRTYYFTMKSLSSPSEARFDIWLSNNADSYIVTSDIPEGMYVIETMKFKMSSKWRSTKANDGGHPLDLKVEVKAGQATILPYLFSVLQEDNGSYSSSSWRIDELNTKEIETVRQKFSLEKDATSWLYNEKVIKGASI